MVDFAAASRDAPSQLPPALCLNGDGLSPFVLVCDHASNRIPTEYGDLGLTPTERLMHVAWDPGALAVARQLSDRLDAPLVQSTVCRLIVDPNRFVGARDLIPVRSERTDVPGNRDLDTEEVASRISAFHAPFHAAIESLLDARTESGRETILVTVHSFTPTYHGIARPWPIGLIHGADEGFSLALKAALLAEAPALNVGWNEPYSSMKGVTYTLEHHGDGRRLPGTMIEIRHDEILTPAGVDLWSQRLARGLTAARAAYRASRQTLDTWGATATEGTG